MVTPVLRFAEHTVTQYTLKPTYAHMYSHLHTHTNIHRQDGELRTII